MADKLSLNAVLMGTLAGVCSLPMTSAAQPVTDTGTVAQSGLQTPGDALGSPDERPTKEPAPMTPTRPQSERAGLDVGSFRFFPGLSISSLYDDNIFATRNDPQHGVAPQSDLITVLSPTAVLKSNWARNQLNLDAGADIGRYATHTQENYQDAWLGARGRYDLTDRSNIFAGARISRNHEERGSPDAVQGTEPTVYTELQSHLGFARRFDRTSLRLGGTFEKLNFDNVPSTSGGIINNDLRDRKLYTLGTRISYRLTSRFSPFVQAALDRRRYDTTPTAGFDRDSNGTRLDLGVLLRMANGVHGEAYVGHLTQNYDDPRLVDVSRPDFGARLRWRTREHTNVTAYLDRSMEETVLSGASGYLNTVLGAKLEHRLRPRLRFNVRASVGRSEYQGIDRNANLLVAGAGLKYDVSRYLYLGADYRFLHRDSNLPSDVFGTAYYRNQVMLTLGSQLLAARPPESWPGEATAPAREQAPASPAGFYFGGQMGYSALNAVTSGSRGEGEGEGESGSEGAAENVDIGDMGSHGADAGLFAGYGWLIKRWYLGLELEGDRSRADFYHVNSKSDSRTFSLERTLSYSLSARLGYV
ncbi:MAG TPA: outer membrane beta-barrel protein, partial [Gammaproteobacteria bacterium]|nr:outer membrane beta-barrel protein [Gammaproteobacteria bacterium]